MSDITKLIEELEKLHKEAVDAYNAPLEEVSTAPMRAFEAKLEQNFSLFIKALRVVESVGRTLKQVNIELSGYERDADYGHYENGSNAAYFHVRDMLEKDLAALEQERE